MNIDLHSDRSVLIGYVVISGMICGVVAAIELFNRYSHAAKWQAILLNRPAFLFLTFNFVVGILALLAAKGAATVDLHLNDGWSIPGFFKTILIGMGALAFLRSSFLKFRGESGETDFGPVAVLDSFKAILDKRIDLTQKILMDVEIAEIMKNVDPFKARNDLPMLCLTGLNNCTPSDVQDMKSAVADVFLTDAVEVRSILIGHALYKFCGVDVLRSSVKTLGSKIQLDSSAATAAGSNAAIAMRLASELARIKGIKS